MANKEVQREEFIDLLLFFFFFHHNPTVITNLKHLCIFPFASVETRETGSGSAVKFTKLKIWGHPYIILYVYTHPARCVCSYLLIVWVILIFIYMLSILITR